MIIPFGNMGNEACRAVFDPRIQHVVVSATFLKEIERTKTEETIELFCFLGLVTGEILTVGITEETMAIFHTMDCYQLQQGGSNLRFRGGGKLSPPQKVERPHGGD